MTSHLTLVDELFPESPKPPESFHSPSWTAETELAVVELGNRPASGLMDPGHAWERCLVCGAYRRFGYCRPQVMWGEYTCKACRAELTHNSIAPVPVTPKKARTP